MNIVDTINSLKALKRYLTILSINSALSTFIAFYEIEHKFERRSPLSFTCPQAVYLHLASALVFK